MLFTLETPMTLTSKIALVAVFTMGAAGSAAAAGLPSCAPPRHTTGITTQTISVTNRCSYGVAWYVDREGPNSACFYSPPGATTSTKWPKQDAYHGTVRC
ncbi:MAG TPA: hypothetical protein VK420_22035 [Longimicrobium sp.]|nr:hypothetical protein [Longimicrobium sp.]